MKYYEVHKKTVYVVLADSQQDALDAIWNGEASIEEEEYLVDKVSDIEEEEYLVDKVSDIEELL